MLNFRVFFLICAVLVVGCSEAPTSNRSQQRSATKPLVEVAAVAGEDVRLTVERGGHLRSERTFKLITQEEGQIVALPHHPGDHVEEGESLLQLDDRLLRAELQRATALRRQAEQDLARVEQLEGQRAISDEELARSRTALAVARAEESVLRLRLERTRVVAPFAGLVTERLAEPGDALTRHQHIMTLVDGDRLLVDVSVAAALLSHLKKDDPVSVRIDALGYVAHPGRILRIYPVIEPSTGPGWIEVGLVESPIGAMPGQLTRVTLEIVVPGQLTVPYSALREDEMGSHVLIVDGDGRVQREAVAVVLQYGERVALQGTLEPGMQVVTKGFSGVRDGSEVAISTDQNSP